MISPTVFLLGVIAAVGGLVDAAGEVRVLDSLTEHCKFKLDDQFFDLCPVLSGNEGGWSWKKTYETPPTVKTITYWLDLQKPLQLKSGVPHHEQCPEGTYVCNIVSYERPKHPDEGIIVTEVVPAAGRISYGEDGASTKLKISAQLSPDRLNKQHDLLHIRLHGGWYANRPQTVDLQFRCDHDQEEPSAPTFYYNWNNTHSFSWATKHACAKRGLKKEPLPQPTGPAEDDAPPDDDEGDSADFDRFNHTGPSSFIILCSAAAFVGVVIWSMQTRPAFLRRGLRAVAKAHPSLLRSHVGENVLVRWAEDVGMEGDEDVMVNGGLGMGYALGRVADDEQIPLKPSPKSYGSA